MGKVRHMQYQLRPTALQSTCCVVVNSNVILAIRGIFRGAIGPWPPLWQTNFFVPHRKKLENIVSPPFV